MDNEPVSLVGLPGKIRNIHALVDSIIRDYKINIHPSERHPPMNPAPTNMATYNSPSIVQFYFVGKDNDIAGPPNQHDGDNHLDKAQRPAVPTVVRNGSLEKVSGKRNAADNRASRNAKQDERPVTERKGTSQQQGGRSVNAENSQSPTAADAAGRAFISELRKQRPSRAIRQAVAEALRTFDKSNEASTHQPEQATRQARPEPVRNGRSGGISIIDTAFTSVEDVEDDPTGQHHDPDITEGNSPSQQNNDDDDDDDRRYSVTPEHRLSRSDAMANERADRDDQSEASSDGQLRENMEYLARLQAGGGHNAASNGKGEPLARRNTDVQRGVAGDARNGKPADGKGFKYEDRRTSKTMHLDRNPIGNEALLAPGSELHGRRMTRAGSQAVREGSSATAASALGATPALPPSSASARGGGIVRAQPGATGHKRTTVSPKKSHGESMVTGSAASKSTRTGGVKFPNLPPAASSSTKHPSAKTRPPQSGPMQTHLQKRNFYRMTPQGNSRRFSSPSALQSPEAQGDLDQMLRGSNEDDGNIFVQSGSARGATNGTTARPPTPHPGSPASQQQAPSVSQTPTGQSVLSSQQHPLAQQQGQRRKSPHTTEEESDKGPPTKKPRNAQDRN